jgi:hypothetical protein
LYPKVYAWIERFRERLRAAQARGPAVSSLQGSKAVPNILQAKLTDEALRVEKDPLGFTKGELVDLFPLDGGGVTHKDRGRLVKLTKNEVAIAVQAHDSTTVHIHAPRWNFRIQRVAAAAKLA